MYSWVVLVVLELQFQAMPSILVLLNLNVLHTDEVHVISLLNQ